MLKISQLPEKCKLQGKDIIPQEWLMLKRDFQICISVPWSIWSFLATYGNWKTNILYHGKLTNHFKQGKSCTCRNLMQL